VAKWGLDFGFYGVLLWKVRERRMNYGFLSVLTRDESRLRRVRGERKVDVRGKVGGDEWKKRV
jgi:hypothetical protein